MSRQMSYVCLEDLVPKNHPYRLMMSHIDFDNLAADLNQFDPKLAGRTGFGAVRLFKCLFLQFTNDLSDRELEDHLSCNTAAKLFCGFGLTEKTPDYSVFSKFRVKIGVKIISNLFEKINAELREMGYISDIFNFIDATSLISKFNTWEEYDDLKKKNIEKMNNGTIPFVAADPEARFGCKGNNKFWYGYKGSARRCMKWGFVTKVAVTQANMTDSQAMEYVCPDSGVIVADKGYGIGRSKELIIERDLGDFTIKKNNAKDKNKDKDRFISRIRAAYEGFFSSINKRTRYKGLEKNNYSFLMESIAFNVKLLSKLGVPKLFAST